MGDYGRAMFTMRHPDVPADECYCSAERGMKCGRCTYAADVEQARLDERDAAAAYLERWASQTSERVVRLALQSYARDIRHGDHRLPRAA